MTLEIRESWLAQVEEEILEPERRIVDPHHHFFEPGGAFPSYDLPALWADTATHRVERTVFVQCWERYRTDGPEELRPVGETEWVASIAADARRKPEAAQIGAIVGSTDLRLGDRVRPVLEAHVAASPLFRGIRQPSAWDPDERVMRLPGIDDAAFLDEPEVRRAVAAIGEMGLSLDVYHYHSQLPSLTRLARALPDVPIVLDHLGTPVGVESYAGRRDEVFADWSRDLAGVAECPNVSIKLGGLCMPWNGFGYEDKPKPPTSDEIVAAQGRYYDRAIELFGPSRCMFESNFPVDKCALSYAVLWNAFKKMAAGYSESEKDDLFRGTATRVYRLRGTS